MYATVRTSRVDASCTTAGIRPLELNFAFRMMLFFVMLIEPKPRLLVSESISISDLIRVSAGLGRRAEGPRRKYEVGDGPSKPGGAIASSVRQVCYCLDGSGYRFPTQRRIARSRRCPSACPLTR